MQHHATIPKEPTKTQHALTPALFKFGRFNYQLHNHRSDPYPLEVFGIGDHIYAAKCMCHWIRRSSQVLGPRTEQTAVSLVAPGCPRSTRKRAKCSSKRLKTPHYRSPVQVHNEVEDGRGGQLTSFSPAHPSSFSARLQSGWPGIVARGAGGMGSSPV